MNTYHNMYLLDRTLRKQDQGRHKETEGVNVESERNEGEV